MARRSRVAFRRRTTQKSRLLEWGGIQTPNTNFGANVVTTVVLIAASDFGFKITHFRSVGNISFLPQSAPVGGSTAILSMGIYRAVRGAADIPTALDPKLSADMAADQWLWWTERRIATGFTADGGNAGMNEMQNVQFDVKVKRILDVGDEIVLAVTCNSAFRGGLGVRTLLRPAGI